MATLTVYDMQGKSVGQYEIEPGDLADPINRQLLHDAVVMYQANQRQGSAHSKSRSDVSGSTKKMYRQKGTGNARAGSRRSGVRRGGGHIFALKPRDYSYRLPRKALQAATRMAVAGKLQDDQVVVVDELALDQPQTRAVRTMLDALPLPGASTLIATKTHDTNVYKSARNLENVSVCPISDLNALAVLQPRRMVITRAALDALKDKARDGESAVAAAAAETN